MIMDMGRGYIAEFYIKKGQGVKYVKNMLDDSLFIDSLADGVQVNQFGGCTILTKQDDYEGSWHEYYVTLGSEKKENIQGFLEKLTENEIEFKED